MDGKVVKLMDLGGLYVAGGNACCTGDHHRVAMVFETARFGLVAMIAIGMYDISSITVDTG